MYKNIALFALALALPLAACETEPDAVEGDTITIETPDVDGAIDDAGAAIDDAAADADAAIDDAAADADAAIDDAAADADATADEAAAEVDEAVDGDNSM